MRFVIFLAGFLLVTIGHTTVANATTWLIRADGSGDAPTIQAGVDSATAGDTILVASGSYFDASELLVDGVLRPVLARVDKNLVLISEEQKGALLNVAPSGVGLVLEVSATVSGFEVRGNLAGILCIELQSVSGRSNGPSTGQIGVLAYQGVQSIVNNTLHRLDVGVRMDASDAQVESNEFSVVDCGVECVNGSAGSVVSNAIEFARWCVFVGESSTNVLGNMMMSSCLGVACDLSNCVVEDNQMLSMANYGLSAARSDLVITRNHFENNVININLGNFRGNEQGAVVSENVLVSDDVWSMAIIDCDNITVRSNTLDGGGAAVFIHRTVANIDISNNVIVNATVGLACAATGSITTSCNNIFNTPVQYDLICAGQEGLNGNFSLDPEFCGSPGSGNYEIQSDSPCAPGNQPGGTTCALIGAGGVGCGTVATSPTTLGGLKQKFSLPQRRR